MRIIISISIIFVFSCSNNKQDAYVENLYESLLNNSIFLQESNRKQIETIAKYCNRISFTDSLTSTVKSYLNCEEILENYLSVLNVKEEILYKWEYVPRKMNQVSVKLNVLSKELIKQNIEHERKVWKEYVGLIDENIKLFDLNCCDKLEKDNIQNKVILIQLFNKVEIIYDLAFQLLLKHKIEEEFQYEFKIPKVYKDQILKSGKRELTIYTYSGDVNDGQKVELFIDDVKIEPSVYDNYVDEGEFKYLYDPEETNGTMIIKTVTTVLFNGQVLESEVEYEVPK